jgi:EmrB/QacA subfamily drug resistance transporter
MVEAPGRTVVSPGKVLLAVCSSITFIGINTTAMNTIVGDIAVEFDMSTTTVAWAVSGYLLAAAAFVAPAGQLGDVFGRKRMFAIGLALFAVSSIVIAASPDAGVLILGRVLQGTASALLMPSQLAILRLVYPPEKQGMAIGAWAATAAATFAVGPLYGGVIADSIGWGWMFWFDLVLVGVSAVLAWRYIRPVPEHPSGRKPDWLGAALLAVAIFSFVLAVQQGEDWGWTSVAVLGAFAVAVVLGVTFWFVEHRTNEPLVHFKLLRIKPYLAGVITTFAQGFGLLAFLYFIAIYAESFATYDASPLDAGLLLLPGGLVMFVGALVGGRAADKIGYRGPNTLAMLLMFVGALALMIVNADTPEWVLALLGCVAAAGVGIGFSTTSAAGMAAIEQEVSGEAAGVINVARYLGAVLVVALGTIVMLQVSESRLTSSLDDVGISATETIDLDQAMSQTSTELAHTIDEVAPGQQAEVQSLVADATADGFRGAQLMTALIMLGATIASWVLLRGEKARAPAFPHRGPVAHAVSR